MKVLVINCGSSSVKYQLLDMTDESTMAEGIADRVAVMGGRDAVLKHRRPGAEEVQIAAEMPDHSVALRYIFEALTHREHGVIKSLSEINAVGHRVVHGGERFAESVLIDEEVIKAIEEHAELAPLHNPPNLIGIRACQEHLPNVPHVAVFDTAFHQTMPEHAYLYGLPYELYEKYGVRRYGFHGTSHRYVSMIAAELLEKRGIPREQQRIVTCHLGNGCSMAAVKGGKSVDTTMGFTPLEGLLMGTRCGDLDPALVPFLMERLDMSPEEIDQYLNKKCGLLGVSGVSSDMRDVKAAALQGNRRAQIALEIFCYRVRKYVGAYAAVMGGLDAIVFTAGIGENEPLVRTKVVEGLEFLGAKIDEDKNHDDAIRGQVADISAEDAKVRVFVIPTDEELMIARDTVAIVQRLTKAGK